jgi:hypothetical protein
MGESTHLLRGVVKGGVIVPDTGTELPDGTPVEFRVLPTGFTPDEQAEFDGWDKLGDEAWAMIDWGEGEIARDSG